MNLQKSQAEGPGCRCTSVRHWVLAHTRRGCSRSLYPSALRESRHSKSHLHTWKPSIVISSSSHSQPVLIFIILAGLVGLSGCFVLLDGPFELEADVLAGQFGSPLGPDHPVVLPVEHTILRADGGRSGRSQIWSVHAGVCLWFGLLRGGVPGLA